MRGRGGRGGGGEVELQGPGEEQRGRHTQPCLQVGELGVAQHLQDAAGRTDTGVTD